MDIERRLERLERESRRLKVAGGAVVAVLLTVALVGAVMPQEIPEVIEAREFRVTYPNEKMCASLDGTGLRVWLDDPEFPEYSACYGREFRMSSFLDRHITVSGKHGATLTYQGQRRAEMSVFSGLRLWDERGELRSSMNSEKLAFYDEDYGTRASLGRVTLISPTTGAETTCPAAVVLYNAEGNVIWLAPQ